MQAAVMMLFFSAALFAATILHASAALSDSSFSYENSICSLGEPILRMVSEPVDTTSILQRDSALFADVDKAHAVLLDFNRKRGFGRAIAGCQVGSSRAFIAMRINQSGTPERVTLFNPRIVARGEETFTLYDDCLSFEDLMVRVRRWRTVSVEFVDEKGEKVVWNNCSQAISELLQHEIDHLEGVLAVDRAVEPPCGGGEGIAIVKREEYLARKPYFDGLVDYSI